MAKKSKNKPKTMVEIMKSSSSEVTKSLFTGAYFQRVVQPKKGKGAKYNRSKIKKNDYEY